MPELTSPTTSRKGNSVPTLTCRHSLDTIDGYVVRQTFPGTDRPHVDVAEFDDAESYGLALWEAKAIRTDGSGAYAVVDPIYACGCRGQA